MAVIIWPQCNKLNCFPCGGPVILCVNPAKIIGGSTTLEATLDHILSVNGVGGTCSHNHYFTYDENLIVEGQQLLAADITGAICRGCLTQYIDCRTVNIVETDICPSDYFTGIANL